MHALLQAGADRYMRDKDGRTALMLANDEEHSHEALACFHNMNDALQLHGGVGLASPRQAGGGAARRTSILPLKKYE